MPTLKQTLQSRWNPGWASHADIARLQSTFDTALTFIGASEAQKAELAKPGTLSPKGVDMAFRAKAANGFVAELRRFRKLVADHADQLKADRAALGEVKIDRTDVLAEMQRREVRDWLRGLDPMARVVALTGATDQLVFEAVLGAPAALTGLSEHHRQEATNIFVEKYRANQLEAIEARSAAHELISVAVSSAVNDVAKESGLDAGSFATWFETGVDPEAKAQAA